MATSNGLAVGDLVELSNAASDTAGTVVAIVRDGHVKVQWATGEGLVGKTTMLSVRVLRRRRELPGGRCPRQHAF